MKKLTLAILYFGMMIQPIHAESLTEKAKKVYDRAIALAKKGGSRSQELLKKARLLHNANKKKDAAEKALHSCEMRYCINEYEENQKPLSSKGAEILAESSRKQGVLDNCLIKNCALEIKRRYASIVAVNNAILAVLLIIFGLSFVGGLSTPAYEKYESWQEQKARKIKQIEEEIRKGRAELEERPISPVYEEQPGEAK